jgi:hypothetical protein
VLTVGQIELRSENMKKPKKVTKLLLFGIADKNYLLYLLGKHNIYVEAIREINVDKERLNNPFITKIFFEKESDITKFFEKEGINGYRIFKSAKFKNKPTKPKALFGATAMNILGLLRGHTIRIKSENKEYRKWFYDCCVADNAKHKLGVRFDFEIYDVEIDIKEYKASDYTFIVILAHGLKEHLK